MSLADIIPMIETTRMERRCPEHQPLTEGQKRARNRAKNAKRDAWRAARRAKGLPYT